jgi:outer membrane biosynthesis protein TonB
MASLNTMASLKTMVSTRWSLMASLLLHGAIVAAGIIALPSLDTYEVEETESIPVEIVDIQEISARQAVSKDAEEKPEEPVAPPKIEEAETPKPAPQPAREVEQAAREPEPEPAPLPELEPLDELIEAAAAEPEPVPAPEPEPEKAEAKPVPVPKVKPEPPKRVAEKPKPDFNADEMQALLNKIDETNKAPPKPTEIAGQPKLAEFDSLTGSDETLAADLVDALRRRIESCWTLPAGARNAEELQIRLQFALNPDGMLANYPVVVNASAHPAFDAAARSAQSAVKTCEPYNFLPVDKYDLWRDIILTFDPSRIFALN